MNKKQGTHTEIHHKKIHTYTHTHAYWGKRATNHLRQKSRGKHEHHQKGVHLLQENL